MKGLARTTGVLLRTMWLWVVVPAVVIAGLVWSAAASIQDMYPDEAHRLAYAEVVTDSVAVRVFQGRGYDLTSIGGIFAQETAVVILFLVPLVGVYVGIRFTRWLEDKNYLDIITAGTISRLAPTVGGLCCGALTCLLASVLSFAALVASGYDTVGSALWALALLLFFLWAVSLGALAGQLFRNSAEATFAAVAVVIGFYLLRSAIDVRSWDAVWSTPLSWLAETKPFAETPPAWPYLLFGAAIAGQALLGIFFATKRDLGGGMFAASAGPREAGATLVGPRTLLLRLVRGATLAVLLAGGAVAFTFGFFAKDMATDGLTARIVLLVQLNAIVAAAAGVLVSMAFSREELSGRTGRVLAGLPTRTRWQANGIVIAFAAVITTQLALACLSGLGLSLSLDDWSRFGEALRSNAQQLPAALLIAALSLALGSLDARLPALAWTLVAWAAVVALRADMLQLSEGLRHISPVEWTGKVPVDSWSATASAGMVAVIVVLMGLALVVFRRRDLAKG
ncbi:hypothetical protein [Micromonospora lutea]|uniref:ABC transporter permease n=1 Tax=Micromonospora lutea TaxID=419825 RepID=A0ABQ4IPZ2_9ACTN|nr:hypothetical protein [Micromonospora lutea]GIJ19758.1 ABC transporter permease [Micromonospora lutea]